MHLKKDRASKRTTSFLIQDELVGEEANLVIVEAKDREEALDLFSVEVAKGADFPLEMKAFMWRKTWAEEIYMLPCLPICHLYQANA